MNNLGNKETMAENIQYYLDKTKKTRQQMCDELNIPYTTAASWLQADSYPRIDKIELMARYFNVSKSDLVEVRTEESDSLIDKIRNLPPEKQALVRDLIEQLSR